MTDNDWRFYAACRYHDPELWFPERNSRTYVEQAQAAAAICARCPVTTDCNLYAERYDVTGIWAGQYRAERNQRYHSPMEGVTRRNTGLLPCGTKAAYQRHKRRGETVCDKCRQEINRINRERTAIQREQGHKRRR